MVPKHDTAQAKLGHGLGCRSTLSSKPHKASAERRGAICAQSRARKYVLAKRFLDFLFWLPTSTCANPMAVVAVILSICLGKNKFF